jgi:hypothetical protein
MADQTWIASRHLTVDGVERVTIRIGAPVSDGGAFRCAVEVAGLDQHSIASSAYGADTIQALMLALQMAGDTLYASNEGVRGALRWGVLRDLGFPVSEAIANLVPRDVD